MVEASCKVWPFAEVMCAREMGDLFPKGLVTRAFPKAGGTPTAVGTNLACTVEFCSQCEVLGPGLIFLPQAHRSCLVQTTRPLILPDQLRFVPVQKKSRHFLRNTNGVCASTTSIP